MGYQGSEMDNEVKGEGNSYTTEFRQLDPRLGRWLTIDPMVAKLPWQSPYCSMDNNPIRLNDPLGDYTEKRARKMAARGEKNGYTTEVVENRKFHGGFGVRFSKEVDGKTYQKTQSWGKFTGIGKKGLINRQGFNAFSFMCDPGYVDGTLTNEELDKLNKSANTGPIYGSPLEKWVIDHFYFEANAERTSGGSLGVNLLNIYRGEMKIQQQTVSGMNYNTDDGYNKTGYGGTKDMGKRTGGGIARPLPIVGSGAIDFEVTTYNDGSVTAVGGVTIAAFFRCEYDFENDQYFIGLKPQFSALAGPLEGFEAMLKLGFRF